jgi:hypothetical protein
METTQKVYTAEELHDVIEKILLKYTEHPKYGKITRTQESGHLAVVKSCREGDDDKPRLAVYLGDVLVHDFGIMNPLFNGNPCLLLLDKKDLILGMESWWKLIPKEKMSGTCISLKNEFSFTWEDIRIQMEIIALVSKTAFERKDVDEGDPQRSKKTPDKTP